MTSHSAHRQELLRGLARPPASRLLACLALAFLGTWLIAWRPFSPPEPPVEPAFLEVEARPAIDCHFGLMIDNGHGWTAAGKFPVATSAEARKVVLPIKPGRLQEVGIMVFPPCALDIGPARIRTQARILSELPFPAPKFGRSELLLNGAFLHLQPIPDPSGKMALAWKTSLSIESGYEPGGLEILLTLAGFFGAAFGALAWVEHRRGGKQWNPAEWKETRFAGWSALHPRMLLLGIATGAVLVSCYPLVFFGKSLVSPNNNVPLFFRSMPTLPGAPREALPETKGRDMEAAVLAHLPYSVAESRALWRDGEIPLWYRNNLCGVDLIGQGQSMLGDPIHAITLLAGGASWAWDLKYLVTRILFAWGIGLGAWELTRRLPLAALVAASSVWIGFFAYRYNHPAIFSLCYGPWILLPWLRLKNICSWKQALPWAALLILANWTELNSGTAKESSMMILCMDAAGFLIAGWTREPLRVRAAKLAVLVWACVLFILLSAPFWLTFLDALRTGQTLSDIDIYEEQLPPTLFVALFDGLYSQDLATQEFHINPSGNFLFLCGILWLAAAWPSARKDRTIVALTCAAVPLIALVFGFVPPQLVRRIPFVANISHVANTFGVALLVLLPLLAACGLKHCLEARHEAFWKACWRRMLFLLIAILAFYGAGSQAHMFEGKLLLNLKEHTPGGFFVVYAAAVTAAAALFPLALRWTQRSSPGVPLEGFLLAGVCLFAMHFRHGEYLDTPFENYLVTPRSGMDLVAKSPSAATVKQSMTEPARVCGLYGALRPGYAVLLDFEGIDGPDAVQNRWYWELETVANFHFLEGWALSIEPESLPYQKPILDALNCRYFLSSHHYGAPESGGLALLGESDLTVLQSKEAWPRAFYTDYLGSYRAAADFVEILRQGDGRPLAYAQDAATPEPTVPAPAGRRVVPAHDYRLTANSTSFRISAPGPGTVVLTEGFEDGNFHVELNGVPTPFFRVNHAFKGIHIERAGDYLVRFTYRPGSLVLAIWISCVGLVLVLGTVVFFRIVNRSEGSTTSVQRRIEPDEHRPPRSELSGV